MKNERPPQSSVTKKERKARPVIEFADLARRHPLLRDLKKLADSIDRQVERLKKN